MTDRAGHQSARLREIRAALDLLEVIRGKNEFLPCAWCSRPAFGALSLQDGGKTAFCFRCEHRSRALAARGLLGDVNDREPGSGCRWRMMRPAREDEVGMEVAYECGADPVPGLDLCDIHVLELQARERRGAPIPA